MAEQTSPSTRAALPQAWELRAGIEVVHPFFAEPARCKLSFTPSREAQAWISRAGAVVRAGHHEWKLYLPEDTSLAGNAAVLDITVSAADALFAAVTPGLAGAGMPLPGVETSGACYDPATLTWRVGAPAPMATSAAAQAAAAPLASFVVALCLADDNSDIGRTYRVDLETRATVWKYILVGDWAMDRPFIVDLDGRDEFEQARAEKVAGGGPAMAIRSLAPILLQERSPRRFQLRGRADDVERVLVRRLPAAGAAQLGPDTPGGAAVPVSEIYVQR